MTMTFRKLEETSGNVRKRKETRKEISGNGWNFLKSPKLVFSGQTEKPHILRSGFNVPGTLSVIVRIIFEIPVVELLTIIYNYLVCSLLAWLDAMFGVSR